MRHAKDEQPTKKKPRKKNTNKPGWGGFIDCPLGKYERETFKSHLKSNKVPLLDSLQALVDEKINVSVSWSDRDSAYLAKATMLNESDGKNYMLSAFHEDLETAFALLIFKHFQLLGEQWFKDMDADSEDSSWG